MPIKPSNAGAATASTHLALYRFSLHLLKAARLRAAEAVAEAALVEAVPHAEAIINTSPTGTQRLPDDNFR